MSSTRLATHGTPTAAIRTLLLCDLVASTEWVERVGDAVSADLLARHDRIARDLLSECNGREIDKSDGFLLLFERPIEAVRFALAYRTRLQELGDELAVPLVSRVGIHLGEVVLRENPREDVASRDEVQEGAGRPEGAFGPRRLRRGCGGRASGRVRWARRPAGPAPESSLACASGPP